MLMLIAEVTKSSQSPLVNVKEQKPVIKASEQAEAGKFLIVKCIFMDYSITSGRQFDFKVLYTYRMTI